MKLSYLIVLQNTGVISVFLGFLYFLSQSGSDRVETHPLWMLSTTEWEIICGVICPGYVKTGHLIWQRSCDAPRAPVVHVILSGIFCCNVVVSTLLLSRTKEKIKVSLSSTLLANNMTRSCDRSVCLVLFTWNSTKTNILSLATIPNSEIEELVA